MWLKGLDFKLSKNIAQVLSSATCVVNYIITVNYLEKLYNTGLVNRLNVYKRLQFKTFSIQVTFL